MDIRAWTLARLETMKDYPCVLLRDSLRLLPEADGNIHAFARQHGYTVIVASTNLVFRQLYELAQADPETAKLLVIDRAPIGRRTHPSLMKAPPPFYPDLLVSTPPEARLELDLQNFLKETSGDTNWPREVNDPRYARLIARHLPAVLRAHQNLRAAHANRFTDHDFQLIVAYAALNVADAAFKKLDSEDYWKIGLLGHAALTELDTLVPEVTRPIKTELRQAPPPFCWFVDRSPETVLRAFYLSLILAQHLPHWPLLLLNLDPALAVLVGSEGKIQIEEKILFEAAPKLVAMDPAQADRDLEAVEQSLAQPALQLLLLGQMHLDSPAGFVTALQKEQYSTLIRSLALLLALDNLLSSQPAKNEHEQLANLLAGGPAAGQESGDKKKGARKSTGQLNLFALPGQAAASVPGQAGSRSLSLVERRPSLAWSALKEAYTLARQVQDLRARLLNAQKTLKVKKTEQLSFNFFRQVWNEQRLNRLEYYLSALEWLVFSADLLPRPAEELPPIFSEALERVRQRVRTMAEEAHQQLDELNRRFQELVAVQYPGWVTAAPGAKPEEFPILTSQFLERCLKAHWDPQREQAVLFIFDGMRYDIWDELLRPMLLDRMELVADLPASSILPSETQLTRKAISAGTFPDQFDPRDGEGDLLQAGLARNFHYTGPVEVLSPDTAGTGETVRYRAGNLDVYIFELCDKELHKISMKTLPDGRQVPSRPLAFVYQQTIKNIIDTEVMAIVRKLPPGAKIFITADHGFSRVGRQSFYFDEADLNEPADCNYLNCRLRSSMTQVRLPHHVRQNLVDFTPAQLRLPARETKTGPKTGLAQVKEYRAIVFPKVGYSFKRSGSPHKPDAYSHGGISIPELMIPMVVLRVRRRDEGWLTLGALLGPAAAVEGEELEFCLDLTRTAGSGPAEEIRVELEATLSSRLEPGAAAAPEEDAPGPVLLPQQVHYVGSKGTTICYTLRPGPEQATPAERRQGQMNRTLTVTVSYRSEERTLRQAQTCTFTVQLNSEKIVRRVGNLGTILGLTPKSIR